MIANALPRPLTAGSVDNAILRADGTDGTILQNSSIVIDDATTTTQANVAITNQHAGQTNSALVLTPKGTGALILGPKPDGTTTGGNARGANAVDLQTSRTSSTQVASGARSAILSGSRNTASGNDGVVCGGVNNTALTNGFVGAGSGNTGAVMSVVCGGEGNTTGTGNSASFIGAGTGNSATGQGSVVCGGGRNDVGGVAGNTASAVMGSVLGGSSAQADRYAMQAHAAGRFAAQGDAQRARFVMRNKTTTNAAVELFLDGSSARLTIPSGRVLGLTINITGISSTGAAVAHYMRQYALKNVSGTTSEVYAPITIGTDNAAGTSIALSASDASDALIVSVTGTASTIWRWVASVDAVEIAYGI
jgi:hypothetical protein